MHCNWTELSASYDHVAQSKGRPFVRCGCPKLIKFSMRWINKQIVQFNRRVSMVCDDNTVSLSAVKLSVKMHSDLILLLSGLVVMTIIWLCSSGMH